MRARGERLKRHRRMMFGIGADRDRVGLQRLQRLAEASKRGRPGIPGRGHGAPRRCGCIGRRVRSRRCFHRRAHGSSPSCPAPPQARVAASPCPDEGFAHRRLLLHDRPTVSAPVVRGQSGGGRRPRPRALRFPPSRADSVSADQRQQMLGDRPDCVMFTLCSIPSPTRRRQSIGAGRRGASGELERESDSFSRLAFEIARSRPVLRRRRDALKPRPGPGGLKPSSATRAPGRCGTARRASAPPSCSGSRGRSRAARRPGDNRFGTRTTSPSPTVSVSSSERSSV